MGVELSKALNILAHELRGPLGVIQGYLRLLRQRRSQDEDDTRMLTAMQDATGRIAGLGRQAVDLATVLQRPAVADAPASVAETLGVALRNAAVSPPPAMQIPDPIAAAALRFGKSPEVGAALAAVLQAVSRDAAGGPVGIVGVESNRNEVQLRFGPLDRVGGSDTAAQAGGPEHLRLERGGLGLSLVLASYVFDAIGARLTSIGNDGSAIAVTLQKDGGLQ
jgi:signal transduction histidine kinase